MLMNIIAWGPQVRNITQVAGQRYLNADGHTDFVYLKFFFSTRKCLRFEILRTTVISLRGDRRAKKNLVDIENIYLNLEPQGQG